MHLSPAAGRILPVVLGGFALAEPTSLRKPPPPGSAGPVGRPGASSGRVPCHILAIPPPPSYSRFGREGARAANRGGVRRCEGAKARGAQILTPLSDR